MKTAFLLGAGASKDAGLPLSSAITDMVLSDQDGQSADQSVLRFLHWMKEQVAQTFGGENRSPNYEDLAYMAGQIHDHLLRNFENPAIHPLIQKVPSEMRFRPQVTGNGYADQLELLSSQTLEFIRNVVWRSVTRWPAKLKYLRFLIDFPNDSYLNIFTLNNDTLVEQFLLKEQKDFVDGFEPSVAAMDFMDGIDSDVPAMARLNPSLLEQEAGPGTIRLFKLHGSVNWFRYRADVGNNRDEFRRIGVSEIALKKYLNLPPANRPDLNLPELLVGTFNKLLRYTSSLYRPLHYGFHRELETTDRLLVCGYSFGDKGINEQIVNWLDGNPHRRMAIINACTEEQLWNNARRTILIGRDRWRPNKQFVLCLGEKLKCVDWSEVWSRIRS